MAPLLLGLWQDSVKETCQEAESRRNGCSFYGIALKIPVLHTSPEETFTNLVLTPRPITHTPNFSPHLTSLLPLAGSQPAALCLSNVVVAAAALTLPEVPESVTVQEGLCVLVPCTFFHSGLQSSTDTVFGYWFLDGTNILYGSPVATNNPHRDVDMDTRGRFQLVGDPQDNNCSLGIRDGKRKDTGRYFFRIQSSSVRLSYKDKQLSLWVTELTEVPVVDVPETLQSGRRSNITCLVPWAFLDPGANPTPVLPITPTLEDHGANLTCQATFPGVGVTVERTVQLNVSYAPQNLSISVSWGAGTGRMVCLIPGSVSVNVRESECVCMCECEHVCMSVSV
ncbi:sialic acid-binding Ig-like lectin 13 [Dipodomys merriami]|uniref:sialic acid-binding Ig-like lectin 13 n=1 Tax=Dipodomys merriami TaxID=94247 RepID=UPI003855B1B6